MRSEIGSSAGPGAARPRAFAPRLRGAAGCGDRVRCRAHARGRCGLGRRPPYHRQRRLAQGHVSVRVQRRADGVSASGLRVGASRPRSLITERWRQGQTPDEIIEYFVATYGEKVLAAPTKSGFNIVAWVTPFVVLIVGTAAVFLVARTWSAGAATTNSMRSMCSRCRSRSRCPTSSCTQAGRRTQGLRLTGRRCPPRPYGLKESHVRRRVGGQGRCWRWPWWPSSATRCCRERWADDEARGDARGARGALPPQGVDLLGAQGAGVRLQDGQALRTPTTTSCDAGSTPRRSRSSRPSSSGEPRSEAQDASGPRRAGRAVAGAALRRRCRRRSSPPARAAAPGRDRWRRAWSAGLRPRQPGRRAVLRRVRRARWRTPVCRRLGTVAATARPPPCAWSAAAS